ncbi:hypothetical protein DFJ73DRAFT_868113, partial [Zopfochytrium polystomum]
MGRGGLPRGCSGCWCCCHENGRVDGGGGGRGVMLSVVVVVAVVVVVVVVVGVGVVEAAVLDPVVAAVALKDAHRFGGVGLSTSSYFFCFFSLFV